MAIRARLSFGFIFLAVLLVYGCVNLGGGGGRQTARFFMLNSMTSHSQPSTPQSNDKITGLGIGPVSIPKLLDRRQVITRISNTEIKVNSFSYWAEPLSHNIPRVLSENLSQLLAGYQVRAYPWVGSLPDYQIRITVLQFDSPLKGEAILSAKWEVIESKQKEVILQKQSTFKKSLTVSEVDAMIPVLSQLIADFSKEIATAIDRTLAAK